MRRETGGGEEMLQRHSFLNRLARAEAELQPVVALSSSWAAEKMRMLQSAAAVE